MISKKKTKQIHNKCSKSKIKHKIIKHKIVKHKIVKHIKHNYNKLQSGSGGILSAFGSAIYKSPKKKDYSVHLPGSQYTELLNPKRYETFTKKTEPSLLTVIYNYRNQDPKKYQVNLNTISNNTVLKSSQVENEPHIIIDSINRYLVIMYDINKQKLHWVIVFEGRSLAKTILSYLSPKPNDGIVHKYAIELFNYPKNITQFTVVDMYTPKRRRMFREAFNYIKTNNLSSVIKREFNVKLDVGGGINIYNILSKTKTQKQTFKNFKTSKLYSSSKT